jgi:TrmH family RNA methyltransferase
MTPAVCKIILVHPRDPNNIGAAARAMKNFGFTDLAVIAPHPPVWDEVVSAVNAEDVLRSAKIYPELSAALADCTMVLGTADRTRVEGKQKLMTPSEAHQKFSTSHHKIALVFGGEKHGLSSDDLALCHHVVSLPTVPECPSMNLGQSVAVFCYQFAQEIERVAVKQEPLATVGAIEVGIEMMMRLIREGGFFLNTNEAVIEKRLRQRILGMTLTKREINTMCGALRQIAEARTPLV